MLLAEFSHGPELISQGLNQYGPLLLQNADGGVLLQNSLQKRCCEHRNSPITQSLDQDGKVSMEVGANQPI